MLGVTETTRITTVAEKAVIDRANEQAIARALETGEKATVSVPYWQVHPEKSKTGPCDICLPLHDRPEWDWPMEFTDGPGAHPNCVCDLAWREVPADQVPTAMVA